MIAARQKIMAKAALTLGGLLAPICTAALIPHSASSRAALHLSSPAVALAPPEAAVSEMCRNDPVNNFDPLGLSSLDRYLADLVENVGGGANAVSCFFDERDAADQRLRGGIRSFAGSVGEAVGLIGSVQAHRAEAILNFGFGRESRVTMLAGDCGGWFHDRAQAFCVSAGDLAWTFSRDALSAAVERQAQHAELASLARAVQERGWRTVGAEFAPHYAGFAAGLVDGNWRDPKFQTAATFVALDFATVLLNWSASANSRGLTAAESGFVRLGGSEIRKINIRPTSNPKWGLTSKHLDKHFWGDSATALKQIDPGGTTDKWAQHLTDLYNAPVSGTTPNGMLDIIKQFPKADGSGMFNMGIRLAPRADGTYDLVTVLTRQ